MKKIIIITIIICYSINVIDVVINIIYVRTLGLSTLGPVFCVTITMVWDVTVWSGRNVPALRGRYCVLQRTLSPNDGQGSHVCKISLRMAVAQLFEVLRYKSKGRGFESRWCH
jgi:hypothetical protein